MKRLLALAALLLPTASFAALGPVTAETQVYKPASVAAPFMSIPIGARAASMGDAYTAAADDLYSLHWNPAGLADVSEFQLGLMHNEHYAEQGVRQEFLSYAHPMNDSSLAFSVNYLGLGALELRADDGALNGESNAMAFAGTLGYGKAMGKAKKLRLGMSAEFGAESLYDTSLSSFGGSLGVAYDPNEQFRLALSALHLGASSSGFMPPANVALGTSWRTSDRSLLVSAEGAIPFGDDPFVRAGMEYVIAGSVALRGGYRMRLGGDSEGDLLSGPTAGAGFKVSYFQVDYAFVPAGDLTATHRVSATLALPNDFFKPKVVVESTQNTTYARAKYLKGRELYKKGKKVPALIEFKQAVDAYPIKKGVKPMSFYGISLKAIARIEKELQKKGGNEKIVAAVNREIRLGEARMAKKDYLGAIEKFRRALELDENNARARELTDQANAKWRARKAALRDAAKKALAEGNLAKGIALYRKVLDMDPNDSAAKSALAAKRNLVIIEIKKMHRKGIDHYVNGRIKEAVTLWKKALALDPTDPVKLQRDIDKGNKLLQAKDRK